MENASKALIIAGAILLSIAIIGIGMSVFNQASETVNKSNMSSTEIAQFNAQFESYEGNIKGSRVKSLYSAVIASNAGETGVGDRIIEIDGKTTGTDIATLRSAIKSSSTYTVQLEYDEGGIIYKITTSIAGAAAGGAAAGGAAAGGAAAGGAAGGDS